MGKVGVFHKCFFFSSRRRHTRFDCDWSSDVCSSDLALRGRRGERVAAAAHERRGVAAVAGKRGGGAASPRPRMGKGRVGGKRGMPGGAGYFKKKKKISDLYTTRNASSILLLLISNHR